MQQQQFTMIQFDKELSSLDNPRDESHTTAELQKPTVADECIGNKRSLVGIIVHKID